MWGRQETSVSMEKWWMRCDKFVFGLHSGNIRTEILKTHLKPSNTLKTMQDVVAETKARKQDLIEHKIRTTSINIIQPLPDTKKIYTICVWRTTRRKCRMNMNNIMTMLYIRSETTAQCKHWEPRKKIFSWQSYLCQQQAQNLNMVNFRQTQLPDKKSSNYYTSTAIINHFTPLGRYITSLWKRRKL